MKKVKLIVGITAPPSVDLLKGQLAFFKSQNFDVFLLAPDHERVHNFVHQEGVDLIPVKIERNISLGKDLFTLFELTKIFLKEKPDIVNLGTPKMSLLGMLAAWICRVPIRIYTCRGFRFEHETGKLKTFLVFLEKITSFSAHKVICISQSVAELGLNLKIFPQEKVEIIAHGSSNGVDLAKFSPLVINQQDQQQVKEELGLKGKFVYGFVGRIVDRKGIYELYQAFAEVYIKEPDARLLVVGRPFWDQIKDPAIVELMNDHPGIVMAGFVPLDEVPLYYSILDVFVLPAWWEGFGNVLIQAAAMGIPVISTEVTGCKDAVKKDFNGLVVSKSSIDELISAMLLLKKDNKLLNSLGDNGLKWAQNFKPEIIWSGLLDIYLASLEK